MVVAGRGTEGEVGSLDSPACLAEIGVDHPPLGLVIRNSRQIEETWQRVCVQHTLREHGCWPRTGWRGGSGAYLVLRNELRVPPHRRWAPCPPQPLVALRAGLPAIQVGMWCQGQELACNWMISVREDGDLVLLKGVSDDDFGPAACRNEPPEPQEDRRECKPIFVASSPERVGPAYIPGTSQRRHRMQTTALYT